MNDKVNVFLSAQKKAEKERYNEQKYKTLIDLGLFEKEYSPDNICSDEFPFSDWDSKTETYKYFKEVPIEVTDEEYDEIKKYCHNEESDKTSTIAAALSVIAWVIFIGGFIAGIIMGNSFGSEFSFGIAFASWISTLFSGLMILGFAEIIKLLHAIKNKK